MRSTSSWQRRLRRLWPGAARREALEESEARHRALVEASPDGIVVLVEGNIVFANAAAARIFGARVTDELLGLFGPDLIVGEGAAIIAERNREVESSGVATAPIEVKANRLSGGTIDVELWGLPVTFDGRKADLSFVRDLTERRRAQETRSKLHEAAQEQAVTRDLVRRMLRETSSATRAPTMRALGRSLAADLTMHSLPDFLRAFESMGGGRFDVDAESDGRYIVVGRDLLERREGATQPTCALPLGFLEGAITRIEDAPALGTETRCQSLGHDACVFIVQARPVPAPPRAAMAPEGIGKPS